MGFTGVTEYVFWFCGFHIKKENKNGRSIAFPLVSSSYWGLGSSNSLSLGRKMFSYNRIYLAGAVSFRPRYFAFSWWQEFKFISSAKGQLSQPNGLISFSLIVSLPAPCCPSLSIVIAWAGYLPVFFQQQVFYIAHGFFPESEATCPVFLGLFRKPLRSLSANDQPNFYVINIHLCRGEWMGKSLFPLKSVEKLHSFTVRGNRHSIHHYRHSIHHHRHPIQHYRYSIHHY